MNKIFITGNLTAEPEIRVVQTASGQVNVTTFTVAVNRRNNANNGTPNADFFRVTTWRGLADNCYKWLHKGKKVAVVGAVSGRAYTANDGSARASLEVNADDVEFLSPNEQSNASVPAGYVQDDGDALPWETH